MTFDPNFILTGLDGKPLQGEQDQTHAGKILATALFYATENRLKFHGWAMKLYEQKPIELDEADKKTLVDFIEKSKFPAVTYAPLMKLFDAKEEKTEEVKS